MGSRLVSEYVSQTTSVLCSVLKVCSIIWRCFVFLDITEEMFLATDLVLSPSEAKHFRQIKKLTVIDVQKVLQHVNVLKF